MFEKTPLYFNFARDVMDAWAQRTPDARALWCVDEVDHTETTFTFRQLADEFHKAAAFFSDMGIGPGDRVLLVLPRIYQWWTAALGLIYVGAVPIPGTTLLTEKDIKYRIEAADVNAIVTDESVCPKVGQFSGKRIVVGSHVAGWENFDDGVRQARTDFRPPLLRADDPGIIYFTSGTVGPPKMALHTQASYGLGHRMTGQLWLDLKPGDIHWALADTGWGKTAWSNLYGPWHMGACVFVLDSRTKFSPGVVLRTLSHYPINTWCAPPTALRLIVADHELDRYRFPHLRHCVAAGEALNGEVLTRWRAATGLTIHEGYGQTESLILIGNFRCMGHEVRPGSMGRPSPMYDIALLDDHGNEMPDGSEGRIAVRVQPRRPLGLFKEYWKNPEETAQRFEGDWYLTGDMARRDAEGYYWFLGRADDVINSSSYRIGPFEVESALAEHPHVLEAAVVGVPDKLRGEVVKAYVVLRNGQAHTDSLKHELHEHCKRVTAPYKYPRQIEFLDELPKTISGKIRRVELRQRH